MKVSTQSLCQILSEYLRYRATVLQSASGFAGARRRCRSPYGRACEGLTRWTRIFQIPQEGIVAVQTMRNSPIGCSACSTKTCGFRSVFGLTGFWVDASRRCLIDTSCDDGERDARKPGREKQEFFGSETMRNRVMNGFRLSRILLCRVSQIRPSSLWGSRALRSASPMCFGQASLSHL